MSKKFEVYLGCSLCSENIEFEIDVPEGWDSEYQSLSCERVLCPSHAPIKEFLDNQCPGCVAIWGDCPLYESFAYSGRRRTITERDYEILKIGICPRRVGCTLLFNSTTGDLEDIDLSERSTAKAGKMLADAIREYSKTYSNK